jgi:catalase
MKRSGVTRAGAADVSTGSPAAKVNAATDEAGAAVDALNGVFGVHKGARPVHAKGRVLTGVFAASPYAESLSAAPHFQAGGRVPVTVRFSNFAGIPAIGDNDDLASPRGMAIKFKLADGSETDIVAHSFNGFPAATTAEFRDLLAALGASKADAPKPTPLDKFLASHPIAKAFLTAAKPNPVSYATLPYFGVNSFRFTSEEEKTVVARYQILPVAGEHYLDDVAAKAASQSYLSDEIQKRIADGRITFRLVAQIATPDDKIEDPSIAWPSNRKTVELGTISLSTYAGDDAANPDLVFMPNAVPDGIEPADPMITDRAAVYAVSFARRRPS